MQCEQPGGDRVPQQMRIDPLGDCGATGDIADDLANTLAGQHVRRWTMALLPAGEQGPNSARADMQPEQLRQFPSDWHFASFPTLAPVDGDHPLRQADILDPQVDQLGGSGAGLQQSLPHQSDPTAHGISLVDEAQPSRSFRPVFSKGEQDRSGSGQSQHAHRGLAVRLLRAGRGAPPRGAVRVALLPRQTFDLSQQRPERLVLLALRSGIERWRETG
jgi:hypothetical protein